MTDPSTRTKSAKAKAAQALTDLWTWLDKDIDARLA